jgi:NADPH:quinone reductase-like Zn-dependent oxidoreductase
MSTDMMRAVRFHEFGSPEVLSIDLVPCPPSPEAGQVLVRVHDSAINPIDAAMRAGLLQNRAPVTLPAIPGVELSGTIEAIGPDVSDYRVGQAVYSNAVANLGHGTNAEHVLLPVSTVAPMPRNLSFEEAASVAHGARTAWSGLYEYGDLQPGQRILVQGGAGGVGSFVVQMAHHAGAYVMATASTPNLDFLRELGADEVVDYTKTNAEDVVHDVDMVYDCVGGEVMDRSWQILKKGGTLISAVGFPHADQRRGLPFSGDRAEVWGECRARDAAKGSPVHSAAGDRID